MPLPRSFFQQIGSKGGRNGKYSLAKRESARHAAQRRWAKHKLQKAAAPRAQA